MKTHFLKIRIRGGKKKTFSISKLSKKRIEVVKKCKDFQCGLTGWFSKHVADVPKFFKKFFDFNCDKHDLGFSRGGGLFDFLESNWNLIKYTHLDIIKFLKYSELPIINRIIKAIGLLILTWGMIILISTVGLYAFDWGEYKTFEEIIKKRCKK